MKFIIIVFASLLIFAFGCTSSTVIKTNPSHADVYVNNKFIGKSPVSLSSEEFNNDLKIAVVKGECLGFKAIKKEKKGLVEETFSQTKEIFARVKSKLKEEEQMPKEIILDLKCASIKTDPPEADVYINKNLLGKSTIVLEDELKDEGEIVVTFGSYQAKRAILEEKKKLIPQSSTISVETLLSEGEGFSPKEILIPLDGQVEIGAFRIGTQEEKEDLETAMEVLSKLKNPSNTVIIYDASGSMRWPLSEKSNIPRFQPGQGAIIDFIKKASSSDFFGLIFFGHRLPSGPKGTNLRIQSCRDIELAYPIQKINKNQLVESISRLHLNDHKGDTPLEQAIRVGIEALKDKPGDKKIVLVTDGDDECGGRPDRAAREAAKYGIKVHTLAFGIGISKEGKLSEKKAEAVWEVLKECANAGGGLFFNTKGADDLYRAMMKVELAIFTYSVKDVNGQVILTGNLGQKFFLKPGQYELFFNTDKPFSDKIEVQPAKNTKVFIALSKERLPELRKVIQ